MSRPDHIKCIRRTHADHQFKTWCGREALALEFYFVDASHAAENGAAGGRLVACRQCVGAVREALNRNRAQRGEAK